MRDASPILTMAKGDDFIRLRPHPNIVEMKTAFADRVPDVKGAIDLFPDALPARLVVRLYVRTIILTLKVQYIPCL